MSPVPNHLMGEALLLKYMKATLVIGILALAVTASATDRALAARVAALAETRGRWSVEPWSGLPIEDLLGRAGRLGPDTALFFTNMGRDANGRTTFPAEALPQSAMAVEITCPPSVVTEPPVPF